MKCLMCNESRVIQKCHIIPKRFSKKYNLEREENYLTLCANHHYLFDNNKLTKEEYDLIKPNIDIATNLMKEHIKTNYSDIQDILFISYDLDKGLTRLRSRVWGSKQMKNLLNEANDFIRGVQNGRQEEQTQA